MNEHERLMWVHTNMPEGTKALENFITVDPRWNGADWIDILDVLLDTDSHIELTEPLYEQAEAAGVQPLELVCPIAVTLLWSHRFDSEVVLINEVSDILERVASFQALSDEVIAKARIANEADRA